MLRLKATTRAVKKLREMDFPILDDHPHQNIWWRHAQALRANKKNQEADEALEMAYDFLLKGIESLRDDGLRRNYLNKVRINREILQAWDKNAAKQQTAQRPPILRTLRSNPVCASRSSGWRRSASNSTPCTPSKRFKPSSSKKPPN